MAVPRAALPLGSHTWNVPAALSGAAACLFVREITDMRRYFPRHYRIFGWLAGVFVVLAFSNFLRMPETNPVITAVGNLIFSARRPTRWWFRSSRGCAAAGRPAGSWSRGGCSK